MIADKFITPASPERVSLADAYFHFRATGSRSDRQAIIDLSAAIRSGNLGELIAGKTTELRPGEAKPRNDFNQPIPAEALADRLATTFDYELSKGQWEIPPPGSYFIFEGVTVERDRVLALRPPPPVETTVEDIAKLQQDIDELKARPDIPSEEVAKLQAQVAGLTENASEDIVKVRQEIADLKARFSGKPKDLKRGPKGFSDDELKQFEVKFYLMLEDDAVSAGAEINLNDYALLLVDWGERNGLRTPQKTKMGDEIKKWLPFWYDLKSHNR
jgi:FtsZ-binding cell division protein ZapB